MIDMLNSACYHTLFILNYTDQPTKLFLGRAFSPTLHQPLDEPYVINQRDLVTHAVCLGMTGTGKTGLGIVLLEEVLLQSVPTIIIDPKGDITNLALTFDKLQPSDFEAWTDSDSATQQHKSVAQLAAQTAKQWGEGLQRDGILPERIARFNDRVDVRIYTPGSDAGISVNVLRSFAPPSGLTWARHTELLRDRIAQTCSAILELVGIEADPLKSREHILMALVFESAWRAGQDLDLPYLIRMIQEPPVQRVGMFDLEAFYPRKDRFELCMLLNNIAASPSFVAWQTGEPLDVQTLLQPIRGVGGSNPIGKTRASIFCLAHLDDAERQFFVTLLLSQMVSWMRAQSGTSVMRALVYFDEVYGYCPPFPRNPSSKTPLMQLLKQGRAAGLSVFLATQNPADLDYKGLGNVGTWFVGRLRTERDRMRAREGLEGAGVGIDRDELESPLSSLPPRTFLAQQASGAAQFMQTRWAMSYLRGPLTNAQINLLKTQRGWQSDSAPVSAPFVAPVAATASAIPSDDAPIQKPTFQRRIAMERTALPPDVREVFLHRVSLAQSRVAGANTPRMYRPYLLASAVARITDRASGVMYDDRFSYLVTLDRVLRAPDFAQAQALAGFEPSALEHEPLPDVEFANLPAGINVRWLRQCERLLIEHVYRHVVAKVWYNRTLKVYGAPNENQQDLRQRCEDLARAKRDADAERVRKQFDTRIAALQDKLAREERELTADRKELDARKREEMLTNAESLFNFVLRRRHTTGRSVSYGAQKRRLTQSAAEDVRESEDMIELLRDQLQQAEREYRDSLNAISDKWTAALNDLQEISLVPRKSDIFADVVAIAWAA
jgi:hypothetical protein